MKEYALIGAGGFADEVKGHMGNMNMKCFVDDSYYKPNDNNVYPLSQFDSSKYQVLIAIGDGSARRKIVERLPSDTKYFTFIHPSAILLHNVEIGEGSIVCANSIVTTNCKIGKHSHLNLMTTIGHDCIIGDYFTAAPNVSISGTCEIGNCVYFGTTSCVKEKITICSEVTIGMMAAVVKDIYVSGTYVGTPAKLIER